MHCFRLPLSGLGGAVLRWLSQVALPAGGYFLTQHPKDMRFIRGILRTLCGIPKEPSFLMQYPLLFPLLSLGKSLSLWEAVALSVAGRGFSKVLIFV